MTNPDRMPSRSAESPAPRGGDRHAIHGGRQSTLVTLSLVARTVVVATALALTGGCASSGTPGPQASTPQPQGSTSDAFVCPPEHGSCRGPLQAGSFTATQFRPAFNYVVPGGWENVDDKPGFFFLVTEKTTRGGVYMFRDPYPAPADQTGPDQIIDGVGRDAQALSTWLASSPTLKSTDPAATTLGGLNGYRLDIVMAAGVQTQPYFCADFARTPGDACVAVFGPGESGDWSIPAGLAGPGDIVRIWILDTADRTGTVSVWLDDFENTGTLPDAFVKLTQPILDSLRF